VAHRSLSGLRPTAVRGRGRLATLGTVWRMSVGRRGLALRYGLWVAVPAVVGGVAWWAAFADDKDGWTLVAAAAMGAVGAFGPTVADRAASRLDRRGRRAELVRGVESAELPASVLWLLHPGKAVVPFFGRGWVLRQLEYWAADPDAMAVRLLVGAGGVGKTRLAREFAGRLKGWQCRWIKPQAEDETAGLITSGEMTGRSLLIVDYAEARDRAGVAALLCAAQQSCGVRVLLLARGAGLWWRTMSAAFPQQAHLVDALTTADQVIEVSARVGDNHHPQAVVADAVRAFASRLGRPVPAAREGWDWPADTPVLRLHAAALLLVLDGGHRHGRYYVLDELLGHEARYWRFAARKAGLLAGDDPSADAVLEQAVGVAALIGADDSSGVTELVRRVPLLAGADQARITACASWLAGQYPGDAGGEGLGTVQPDLLAETLAVRALHRCTVSQRRALFNGLPKRQVIQLLTVLGRARTHQDNVEVLIDEALSTDLQQMTMAVIEIAIQFPGVFTGRILAALQEGEFDPTAAREMAEAIPLPSEEMGRLALALAGLAVNAINENTTVAEAARRLNIYGIRLAESGKPQGALKAAQYATQLSRDLVAKHGTPYLPALATFLSNCAVKLADTGQREEALIVSQEAVDIHRTLAREAEGGHASELALALGTHAGRLHQAGRAGEALTINTEAVALRREMVEQCRGAHLPSLAASLQNQPIYLASVGRRAEALIVSQEVVMLCRELAALNADSHLDRLATVISNHASRLAEGGQYRAALDADREAVSIHRTLVARNPNRHLPDLAFALHNLSLSLTDSGQATEAMELSQEATDLYRKLVAAGRYAYRNELAGSLSNLSNQLSNTPFRAQALAASQEATAIVRELVTANRLAFLAELATSRHNEALRLQEVNQSAAAFEASAETVAICRELVVLNRALHLPQLARSLNNHAQRLAEAGQPLKAAATSRESIALRRQLVTQDIDAHLPGLAMSLWHAGLVALKSGKVDTEAVELTAEAVGYLRTLAAANPKAFGGKYRSAVEVLDQLRVLGSL
jgi:tetratricopeptide (TPR) repeat protein